MLSIAFAAAGGLVLSNAQARDEEDNVYAFSSLTDWNLQSLAKLTNEDAPIIRSLADSDGDGMVTAAEAAALEPAMKTFLADAQSPLFDLTMDGVKPKKVVASKFTATGLEGPVQSPAMVQVDMAATFSYDPVAEKATHEFRDPKDAENDAYDLEDLLRSKFKAPAGWKIKSLTGIQNAQYNAARTEADGSQDGDVVEQQDIVLVFEKVATSGGGKSPSAAVPLLLASLAVPAGLLRRWAA